MEEIEIYYRDFIYSGIINQSEYYFIKNKKAILRISESFDGFILCNRFDEGIPLNRLKEMIPLIKIDLYEFIFNSFNRLFNNGHLFFSELDEHENRRTFESIKKYFNNIEKGVD